MSKTEIVPFRVPFSFEKYLASSAEQRLKLLKEMAKDLIKAQQPDYTWETLRQRFEQHSGVVATCEHELLVWKLLLDLDNKDQIIAQLHERMEDLCKEMEEIKEGSKERVFLMGPSLSPGKESDNSTEVEPQ